MPYTLPNTLVITPTGDTRVQGFTKLAANDVSLVGAINTEAGRIDTLESEVDNMTGATQYQAATGTSSTVLLSPLSTAQFRGHGECRLVKSGSDLKLERVGFGRMLANGVMVQIPVAGVFLSTSGLSDSTLYYIYLIRTPVDADSDGEYDSYTLSLSASTTAPTQDATSGIMVMLGDATKTLVGMAQTITGPAWVDTSRQRLVLSYYNRHGKVLLSTLAYEIDVTNEKYGDVTRYVAITDVTTRLEFLFWDDDTGNLGLIASGKMISTSSWGECKLFVSGADSVNWGVRAYSYGGLPVNFSVPCATFSGAGGFRYVDLYAKCNASTGFTIYNSPPCSLVGQTVG